MARKGKIGGATIVFDDDVGLNSNDNVVNIRLKNGRFLPEYFVTFWNSKYGLKQIERFATGNVQPWLSMRQVRQLKTVYVQEIWKEEIASIVREAYKCLCSSKSKHIQAQQLLESELGLDKLSFQKPVGYAARFSTIKLSDILNANRIDAQCFAPDAVFYNDWLQKHTQCNRLGNLLQNILKGQQQEEVIEGATDYCSIKHINGRELTNVVKCVPTGDTPLATTNDLLLAITGATIGKIGIVKRYEQLAFSGDLLRLRVKPEVNPHYLLLVLDHAVAQVQFNRWITGAQPMDILLRVTLSMF